MAQRRQTGIDTAKAIDEIGQLQANIKAAQERITALREAVLKSLPNYHRKKEADIRGDHFKAHIYTSQQASVAWKAIAETFKPPADLVSAHTTTRQQTFFQISPIVVPTVS